MKKLVIFDCDGTLVESESIATKVFTKLWSQYGVHFHEDEFKEKFIGTGKNASIVIETFSKMPSHVKHEGDRILHKEILKSLEPVEGMSCLLGDLKLKKCVASNSSLSYVKTAIEKAQLSSYFENELFSSEQVENPKPAPDLFQMVMNKFNLHPEDCLVIEDSVSGVMGARNAGIDVVGFTGASHFIPSLREKLSKANPTWFCEDVHSLRELLMRFD